MASFLRCGQFSRSRNACGLRFFNQRYGCRVCATCPFHSYWFTRSKVTLHFVVFPAVTSSYVKPCGSLKTEHSSYVTIHTSFPDVQLGHDWSVLLFSNY
ncbi:hypothetical protein CW304_28735 [Bacillus sp. UFRGS-B20]|nr:hypothetical protein CW304_28735 [Bacillus sp. UFRGS-B20]